MAKSGVLSSAESAILIPGYMERLLLAASQRELDVFGEHTLVEDPREADIILFGEMNQARQGVCGIFMPSGFGPTRSYRRFPGKCFLFDSGDTFFPVLPGVYAS